MLLNLPPSFVFYFFLFSHLKLGTPFVGCKVLDYAICVHFEVCDDKCTVSIKKKKKKKIAIKKT